MDPGVYSAAGDSQYGHAHADGVSRFEDLGIELYGAGEYGNVTVTVNEDGSYTVKTEEEASLVDPVIPPSSTDTITVGAAQ